MDGVQEWEAAVEPIRIDEGENMRWDNPNYPVMCSVGPSVPGVEVKLVDGEMRLKALTMFSRYISDDPTHYGRAFDEEGFFKTGDCVEKVGNCYVLHGRANIDGFTLHTGEIETALLSLPYIANAIVFPIHDPEYQERAAAVLQLKPAYPRPPPGLGTLGRDLAEETGLFQFKQPTAVHWLQDDETIPHTANGKVSKVETRERFYGGAGADGRWKREVEVLDLNALEYWRMGGQC